MGGKRLGEPLFAWDGLTKLFLLAFVCIFGIIYHIMTEDLINLGKQLVVPFFVAILTAVITRVRDRRLESAKILAEAGCLLFARSELPYRIMRRVEDGSEDIIIKNHIHDIQEKLEYHRFLIKSRSKWLGEKFDACLDKIVKQTGCAMSYAWSVKGIPSGDLPTKYRQEIDDKEIRLCLNEFSSDIYAFMRPWRRWLIMLLEKVQKWCRG